MQNLKNVKLPNAGLISGVVQSVVYGSAATYGLYNSLFNVEGGHRAIVYNRVVGIKDKVRVARLCVCARVRRSTRGALRLRVKGYRDWASEKGDGLRGASSVDWNGTVWGRKKLVGWFHTERRVFFRAFLASFFSPQIFNGEWRDWKPCVGTGQIGCCIPVVGCRCRPPPHRPESRRDDERASSPRDIFLPSLPRSPIFIFPHETLRKQKLQSDIRKKNKKNDIGLLGALRGRVLASRACRPFETYSGTCRVRTRTHTHTHTREKTN